MSGLSDPFDPASLGLAVATPAPKVPANHPMAALAKTATMQPDAPLWSPQNPLLWFGVILGATAGLIGLTVSGRAGPVAASASVGKT